MSYPLQYWVVCKAVGGMAALSDMPPGRLWWATVRPLTPKCFTCKFAGICQSLIALAFIVVGATFGCYILVVIGQKTLRPTVAGMYNYIQPLVACVAVCFGMDNFNWVKGVAIVLIFCGVYLVTVGRSRAEMEKAGKI